MDMKQIKIIAKPDIDLFYIESSDVYPQLIISLTDFFQKSRADYIINEFFSIFCDKSQYLEIPLTNLPL